MRLDLDFMQNKKCVQRCSKEKRQSVTENDLCSTAYSEKDNLPVRCVGEWGQNKIYMLVQYFGIFATGMKNKWEGQLNYIEICSGPGRCVSRNNGIEFDGTAFAVVKNPAFKHINKALFFDYNTTVVETLGKRLDALDNAKVLFGDYYQAEDICQKILSEINPRSLNLVFIDPTDCSVPFNLVKKIGAALPKVDFIINLASGTDFNRNIIQAFLQQESYKKSITKYNQFLGSETFFTDSANIEYAKRNQNEYLRNSFREYYKKALGKMGYNYFAFERIMHYYDLLFASKSSKGLEFWKKAQKIKMHGQRTLF